jgi:tetratricopeptide (TPR) repeat protein
VFYICSIVLRYKFVGKGNINLRGLNGIVINFLLPIVVLFVAFMFNFVVGILVVLIFVLFLLYKSRGEIFAHIGNVQYMKGKEDKAYLWIGKATKFKDCKPNVLTAFAFLKLKRNEVEDAERILQKVIDSNAAKHDQNKAKATMGLVEWKKGRLYFAINNLEKMYEEYKNTTLYHYLGFLYILKGDLEVAYEFNKEAHDYNNSNQFILNNFAYINFLKKNNEEAENLYKILIEKSPNFLEPYYYYGLVLINKGDKSEGIKLIEKSLGYKKSFFTEITEEEIKLKLEELK